MEVVSDDVKDRQRDFQVKLADYAEANIAEYWIVNLVDRVLEVHREPEASAHARYGWHYRAVARLEPPATVTPLAAPSASIPVAELLP